MIGRCYSLAVTRIDSLVSVLRRFYGTLPMPPRDPFTLFVWEVLSAHSTPPKRDAALAALKRIPALTPDAMWRAPQKKLLDSVALAGPYAENRMRALRTGVDVFRRDRQLPDTIRGPLQAARRALKRLPQMGEGGAYRMLLFAADHPVLPVDARVARAAPRLGYGEQHPEFSKTARSVRDALAIELAASLDRCRRTFLYLSHHGGATCTERDPHCTVCPLVADCPEGRRRTWLRANGPSPPWRV
jgi:endonuclease III